MVLIIIGSALLIIWGISHLIPTKGVVRDFGNISLDNKRVIYMEWINEGLTLIFLGALMIAVTLLGSVGSTTNIAVAISVAAMLVVMSILSLFTGFKMNFLPYKLCPVIFTVSAVLILFGSLM